MKYMYYLIMRPPMPGALPRCGLYATMEQEGYTPSGRHYWGIAIYNRQLDQDELEQYEMEAEEK